MKKQLVHKFFENIVIAAIILVLIHTLVENLAQIYIWPWSLRKTLIYVGFGFDLFFSIEFLLRFFSALFRGKVGHYIRSNHGWVDFVASVPLLILNSGPAALSAFTGVNTLATSAGVFGAIKVIKAIRIARVLRLLRVLKVFRHIKHVDSVMAQRHLSRVATISVTIVIAALVIFPLVTSLLQVPQLEDQFETHTVTTLDNFATAEFSREEVFTLTSLRPDILVINKDNRTLFSRHTQEYIENYYGPADYTYLTYQNGAVEVFIDLHPINANNALADLLHFIIIILVILGVLLLYGPHFASTVSDPIQIMKRGLGEKSYVLQVAINSKCKDDEVFGLAQQYNDNFLPIKNRHNNDTDEVDIVDFDFDDVKKFLDNQ